MNCRSSYNISWGMRSPAHLMALMPGLRTISRLIITVEGNIISLHGLKVTYEEYASFRFDHKPV